MNHKGLIIRPIEDDHFVFGDGKLGDAPVIADGQWDSWLPPLGEVQDRGVEPMDCTSNALRMAVYIMEKQKYGQADVLSEKFLAFISHTTSAGNDPHTVAEALRTQGDCLETDYPYTISDNTWAKFYAQPAQWLYVKAKQFIAQFSFGHSWVGFLNLKQDVLMQALTYSPLSAGVYAWQLDTDTGTYVRPPGAQSEHDVVIYGYVPNQYWKVLDSYNPNLKRLAWDFGFDAVKRYTLNRQIVNPTAWDQFLVWFNQVVDSMRDSVQRGLGLGDYSPERTMGAARSAQWPTVRATHLKKEPRCRVCNGMTKLNVHHKRPFHLQPELELDPENLITLCEGNPLINCHLKFGHWGNFTTKYNPNIDQESDEWLKRFLAKTEEEVIPTT